MNLISLYTAQASATGGRSGGRVATSDGAFDVRLELPPELGGEVKSTAEAFNPEQLFACAWAASVADAVGFAAKQRSRILRQISVTAKISFGQYENDGFGIAAEFQVSLPELTESEAAEIVAEAKRGCPYTKAFCEIENLKISIL